MTTLAHSPGLVTAALVFVGTLAATAAMWKLAPRVGLLAHPNARSSHAAATPTGGGVGFVVPLSAVLALWAADYPPAWALLLAGVGIAALGLADDVLDLRRSVRLGCHVALAALCVLWLVAPGAWAAGLLILGLVWWVNLYNFMDGIDGLAASQALAYAAGVLALGDAGAATPLFWALAAASAAFLCFNWAPARVFMGDAGAGFLGLVTGVAALWLWWRGAFPVVASAILLLTFWFDATYTLIVRVVTGQAFADAHRTHLYQHIAGRVGHGSATALFWLHVVLWLAPFAALSLAFPAWRIACLVVAMAPLAVACVVGRAGLPARRSEGGHGMTADG